MAEAQGWRTEMLNIEQTVISQFGNSPTILQLINNMNAYIDPRSDIDNFFNCLWNIDTAFGVFLDIWGRIVNVGRDLKIPADDEFFGFSEAAPDFYPFDDGTFYDGTVPATQTYTLTDEPYRKLILAKAMANITRMTAPSINQLLQNFFAGRGRCYCNDMGYMRMFYTFEFDLTDYEFAIITQSGVFPRPAGVKAFIFQSDLPLFGFSEAGDAAPFDDGVFLPIGAIDELV